MIDLHTHSTFSDGSLTPHDLVALAAKSGVKALALTDHDTTEGVAPFLRACASSAQEFGTPVDGLAGVELSVQSTHGTMHMLGYLMDCANSRLQELLVRIRSGRDERNGRILEKLNHLGAAIAWSDVEGFSSDGVVGRPHFAKALVAAGHVPSTLKAFSKYLGNGAPAYCERYRPTAGEAIGQIRAAGGVAVLAHPVTLGLTSTRLRKVLVELFDQGLQGIEVYYPEHTARHEALYAGMVRDFGLVATGGSDFHGDLNPLITLGRGFGRLRVPGGCVSALRRLSLS